MGIGALNEPWGIAHTEVEFTMSSTKITTTLTLTLTLTLILILIANSGWHHAPR